MKIYVVGHDEKCGGCNWEAHTVYFAADSQQDAHELFEETGYEITAPAVKQ